VDDDVEVRALDQAELLRVAEIDRSEHIDLLYDLEPDDVHMSKPL
jgi:hypothetical protein